MRSRKTKAGLTINAVAGTHVVVLGFNITEAMRNDLRGFAILRTDHTESESYWLSGTKVFESVDPHPAAGSQFSSLKQPFQTFQWADYSAKPGHEYTYKVVAMYGSPAALEQRAWVEVAIATEPLEAGAHAVHFNRGSPATQEYARRFQNETPNVKGQAAYDWLSRGLVEGIIAFIRRATGPRFGLKGAFYEFQWKPVLDEIGAASQRGAEVHIVFDDIDGETGPQARNEDAIRASELQGITKARTNGKMMHNKFLVLTEDGTPKAVLFGSTNLTENGIFGHANCAHVTENEEIAKKYLAYHDKLATDPQVRAPYKSWTVEQTPAPATEFSRGMAAVFSPRTHEEALEWYGQLAGSAKNGLFMTFAFGMNKIFQTVYAMDDAILRFGLMEKEWNGRNKESQIAAIRALQARSNVVMAIGNRIPLNNFDNWLMELDHITDETHVHWVHLKFMLVDPLSDKPTVVTGSANFSTASTTTNDENMLVIKDDKRVADIYFGEYVRLYSHYAFREAVNIFLRKNPGAKPDDMRQGFLIEDRDWTAPYFDPNDRSARMTRRLYFAG